MASVTKSYYRTRVVFWILSLLLSQTVYSQSRQNIPAGFSTSVIQIHPQDTLYYLHAEFILTASESVLLDSTSILTRAVDYIIDYRSGRVTIRKEKLDSIFSDSRQHVLLVIYKALPLAFRPEYSLRQKLFKKDSVGKQEVSPVSSTPQPVLDDLFGAGLQKSGSITRGFTVGSNRDLSLSSGLRMQFAGKLSDDLDIVAALTDENTPIQPEGTTQTLREVDKVFVGLKAPRYSATLGDFNLELGRQEGGEFARLTRKLQGATGSVNFGRSRETEDGTTLMLTGATLRGKFHTNQFQGIEGNQGPYPLTGKNGERRIIIVAGSERVFVNGEQMTRGETNDYTIDYASGDVVFTSRRLITNASRVTVDFEYADRQFTRNLLAAGITTSLADGNVKVNALFVQEADDPNSPLEGSLDDQTRAQLSNSGADRLRASVPGVRFVGKDSVTNVGRGQYILRDTVVNGTSFTIYVYAPGDSLALYAVSFSTVDRMPADSAGYVRIGIGQFRFAGIGQGNYLPIQFLPIPQLQRVININTTAKISQDFHLTGEYAVSHLDRNRLSALDNSDRQGSALKLGLQFNPREVTIGATRIGDFDLSLSERFVDRRFASLDRYNEVEFGRKWNLESTGRGNEEIREANLLWKPNRAIDIAGTYGLLHLSDTYRTTRLQSDLRYKDSLQNTVRYEREDIRSTDLLQKESSEWTRQRGTAEYSFWKLRPSLRVESEERTLASRTRDSLRAGSFWFLEIAPRLAIEAVTGFRAAAEFQIRAEDSVAVGSLQRASHSFTQVYSAEIHGFQTFSSQLMFNVRSKRFSELFKQRGNTDADVVLVRSQTRYTPLERAVDATLLYEFANQRATRLERVFIRVPKGSGNYRYKGDLNGNGLAEDNEFELTRFDGDYVVIYAPSDQLFPVLDLKTNVRLRLEPERLLRQPSGWAEKALSVLSTETMFRVEEKSTESDARQIYLLPFSRFLNDKTTIAGSTNFTQDLHLFEHRPDFSARLRFVQRQSLVQLVSATERSYNRERSVRVRSQFLPEIGNQTEVVNKTDRVLASSATPRERDLSINTLSSDFSYRPEPAWELGFRIEVGRVVDLFRSPNPVADLNEQSVRTSYALFGAGQLRGELRREEIVLSHGVSDPQRPFPFEFTNGKVIGKSMIWQLAFDYRFSQNMQVTLHYNGRREAGRAVVHVGQVEAKVFF